MNDTHSLNIGCMVAPHFVVVYNSSICGEQKDMRVIKYRYLYIIPPTYKNRSLNIYQLTSPMIY